MIGVVVSIVRDAGDGFWFGGGRLWTGGRFVVLAEWREIDR